MKRKIFVLFVLVALVFTSCTPTPTSTPGPVAPSPTVAVPAAVNTEAPMATTAPEVVEPTGPLGPVALDFAGWNYDSAKAHDILNNFEMWMASQHDPQVLVEVTMSDSGYGEYNTFITTNYAGGTEFDVLYSSDHWLAAWAEAGWVVPLEDYFPKARDYMKDISPFSASALTYNGKIYGLPYYSDVMYFVYNSKMLQDAGIAAPPTTWDEVTQQSLILMEQGITSTPILIGLMSGSWFDEAFFALAYSEGGEFFDEELNPVFETTSGPVYDMIEWLAVSINDTQIMPQKVLEMAAPAVQESFKNGDAAFAIVPGYMMREFNTPGISRIAGYAKISMMPGATHQTNGFTRIYLLGSGALEDELTLKTSLALMEYLGGSTTVDGVTTYHVAKRWAIENSLGFSAEPLWNDPQVERAFSSMVDTTLLARQKEIARSKDGMQAPWFAEWISLVRTEVQKALLRQTTTAAALENIRLQWVDLSEE